MPAAKKKDPVWKGWKTPAGVKKTQARKPPVPVNKPKLESNVTGGSNGKPTQGPGKLAAPKASVVTVKRGDSLTKIARANNTSLATILKLNPRLKSDPRYAGGNRIFAGTKVRLK